MASLFSSSPKNLCRPLVAGLVLLAAGCGPPQSGDSPTGAEHQTDAEHAHAGHDEASSIELSETALKNVGFEPYTVQLLPFTKKNSIPAMVVERSGRSQLDVTAPMTGIVTRVYPIEGEAVDPGEPLFDLRLTHEDLVASQRDFLRSIEELDILHRELARLKSVSEGIIAGKNILDREYAKQKIQAALLSLREALLLHGLSEQQVDAIRDQRRLLKSLTVVAPDTTGDCTESGIKHPFTVQSLLVKPGQQVDAGQSLCVLSDHCRLYVEGKAFEEDAAELNRATKENSPVVAVLLADGQRKEAEEDLRILYLSDSIDPASRAFHFYMNLPNKIIRDQKRDGRRFIGWKYKPGQRFEVRLPVSHSDERLVLPVDAVIQEGAETFVFRQNGNHFDRVAVHVEDRDPQRVVIANDGSVYPGDILAAKGAYQMHLALKNKAGGRIDPHAGHNH
jgi:multidrug efflux pump subunit AcrA (membrane-fusion protein)